MHKLRIGILRGGPSNEYEISLNSGASVLGAIRKNFEDKYKPHDIFIDKEGSWHMDGFVISPESLHHKIDVAFNALHGTYGEDGKVQHFLEIHGIPFTGSGSLASAVGMNKILAKKVMQNHSIKTPYWKELSSSQITEDMDGVVDNLYNTFHLPAVVKPASSGSSVGITIVRNYNDLPKALILASEHGDTVLIEECIKGIEATCGVLENFRDQELYALPVIEIRPHNEFFDYEAKYQGKSQEIVPATFDDSIKKELEELARNIHRLLNLKHYSRSDFIVHQKRGIYALEVNTLPGLTGESLVPKALKAIGSDVHELVDHLIQLALLKR